MKTDSTLVHYGVKNKWACQAGIRSVATGVRLLSPGDQRCGTYRSFHGDSATTSPWIHTYIHTMTVVVVSKRIEQIDRQANKQTNRSENVR